MSALRYAISTNISFAINETVINVSIEQSGIYYEIQVNLHYLLGMGVSGAPRGFGDLGRMGIYFQGAGEHW